MFSNLSECDAALKIFSYYRSSNISKIRRLFDDPLIDKLNLIEFITWLQISEKVIEAAVSDPFSSPIAQSKFQNILVKKIWGGGQKEIFPIFTSLGGKKDDRWYLPTIKWVDISTLSNYPSYQNLYYSSPELVGQRKCMTFPIETEEDLIQIFSLIQGFVEPWVNLEWGCEARAEIITQLLFNMCIPSASIVKKLIYKPMLINSWSNHQAASLKFGDKEVVFDIGVCSDKPFELNEWVKIISDGEDSEIIYLTDQDLPHYFGEREDDLHLITLPFESYGCALKFKSTKIVRIPVDRTYYSSILLNQRLHKFLTENPILGFAAGGIVSEYTNGSNPEKYYRIAAMEKLESEEDLVPSPEDIRSIMVSVLSPRNKIKVTQNLQKCLLKGKSFLPKSNYQKLAAVVIEKLMELDKPFPKDRELTGQMDRSCRLNRGGHYDVCTIS